MDGYVDFEARRSTFVETSPAGGARTETRTVGADTWTTAFSGQPAPAGVRWVHLPQRSGAVSLSSDPQELLASLAKSGGRASGPDEQVVEGRRLQHYAVSGLPGAATVDLYLDEDDLLRRLVTKAPLPGGAVLTLRLDVLSYSDDPVAVEPPPAREVVELADLGKSLRYDEPSAAGTPTP